MDLLVFGRVLWRFRVLVLLGLILSLAAAFLALVRVDFRDGGVDASYRDSEVWQANTTLLLTQPGFPWGRVDLRTSSPTGEVVNLSSLSYLSVFYSKLANGDQVQRRLYADGSVRGVMTAGASTDSNDDPLPFLTFIGTAATARDAVLTSRRGAQVFTEYLAGNQTAAQTPASERVRLSMVTKAQAAVRVEGRKKTGPVFVFLAMMIATLGLVFVLENLRPRMRLVAAPPITLPSRKDDDAAERVERAT